MLILRCCWEATVDELSPGGFLFLAGGVVLLAIVVLGRTGQLRRFADWLGF